MFLPTEKGVSAAAYHPGLHTDKYYETVNKTLALATTREQALEFLDMIGKALAEGTFEY